MIQSFRALRICSLVFSKKFGLSLWSEEICLASWLLCFSLPVPAFTDFHSTIYPDSFFFHSDLKSWHFLLIFTTSLIFRIHLVLIIYKFKVCKIRRFWFLFIVPLSGISLSCSLSVHKKHWEKQLSVFSWLSKYRCHLNAW